MDISPHEERELVSWKDGHEIWTIWSFHSYSYSCWYDLYSGTLINQESNTIRSFKCFWVLIFKHLEVLFPVLFICLRTYIECLKIFWQQQSNEHIHKGTASEICGNSLLSPISYDQCRWHFITLVARSFTQPGWYFCSQCFTAGTDKYIYKYVLLNRRVAILITHVSRDFKRQLINSWHPLTHGNNIEIS